MKKIFIALLAIAFVFPAQAKQDKELKDNDINIYDLSAVVSYFASEATVENGFAKYDLNRDGRIDSKDVAYVLVSWNN